MKSVVENGFMDRSTHVARAFCRSVRGSVAVETAISIPVLVFAFAGLMALVQSAYVSDTMNRAARAAARAIALVPEGDARSGKLDIVACTAIRRELDLAEAFDCGAKWTLTVDTDLTAKTLLQGGNGDEDAGDMVVVRIAWNQVPWEVGTLVASFDEAATDPVRKIAVGVARRETRIGN